MCAQPRRSMKQKSDLAGILLAAGRSRRFGSDKLVHPLQGTPMAIASSNALRAALPRTLAVIRPDNDVLAALFTAHGVEIVIAEHADSGMGASLAAGIAAAMDASGWVIALGDMPFILPRTIAQVAAALKLGAGIAAPSYKGKRGHPVGFSDTHREALLELQGDEGARVLLRQNASELVLVDCDDAGILADIDTL